MILFDVTTQHGSPIAPIARPIMILIIMIIHVNYYEKEHSSSLFNKVKLQLAYHESLTYHQPTINQPKSN